jgi:hypothetical protein
MAKLTGAKKAAFLKRMALGRKKAKTVKKTPTRKRKSVTTKRKSIPLRRASSRKRTMVNRSRSKLRRTVSRGSKGIGSSLKTGVIGDVVKGIGAGSLITLVMSRVAPGSSITPIAATGAAFLTGGIVGGAANLILTGGLSQLGGMFGGASTPQQEFGV